MQGMNRITGGHVPDYSGIHRIVTGQNRRYADTCRKKSTYIFISSQFRKMVSRMVQ